MARKAARNEQDETGGAKSARTRQRILDAAAHVLSRKGYAGTRLTDVAEAAELQAPAIYYYFPSREDLIEEVMWSGIAHMAEHVQAQLDALPPEAAALDRIEVAVESHLRYQLEISDYTTAATRNAGQIPEGIRVRYSVEANRYGDIWRKLLDDAKRDGSLRVELDARAARMLVLGALNWAAEWWNPRRGSLEQVIRTAKSIVRSGLAASPEDSETTASASKRPRARKAAKTPS
ncbi:TetR/AcrR family transcriptional regulator [Saccharopolyspora terrae]|uniref:TetR/AcrR family transcriptional regulator n=1 Tax=Saccharopolyspora terrae TaxID=2530384 RepID=A0A4R4VE12_9PSEU|nr:TetR/AcrR family transcriptional regulator [Saccharopolyspora terrae]TDD03778.1 TetR/AcrR family transcriptional regulator [Saccharopolyspora terrae]